MNCFVWRCSTIEQPTPNPADSRFHGYLFLPPPLARPYEEDRDQETRPSEAPHALAVGRIDDVSLGFASRQP
jgi:hypothetical protein